MALDIMQLLVEYLCPTASAQSACNTFISSPSHQVMQPFGPLLFFVFFPMVFLIMFIYVGSRAVMSGHKGINLLIGIAFLIFIIIQGLYPVILWLGELWYIILILLFIFYFITKRHSSGSGGGAMPSVGGGGGIFKDMKNYGKKKFLTGEIDRLEKKIDISLKEMEKLLDLSKHDPNVWRTYSFRIADAWSCLENYKNAVSIGGRPIEIGPAKKAEKLKKLLDKITKLEAKAVA